jgi:NADH-quinone oxidoreductase subunit E
MALPAEAARELVARYPSPRSAILPLLWLGQETDGHVTPETVAEVAAILGLHESDVESVLSFYSMFRRRPPARYRLLVCRSLACAMKGAEDIVEHVREQTGVGPGEQSADGAFEVDYVECIAACDHAPACLFNEHMGGPLSREGALKLLRGEGERR